MALVTRAQFQTPQRGRGLAAGLRTMQDINVLGQQTGQLQRTEDIRNLLAGAQPNQQQEALAAQSLGLGEDPAIALAAPTQDQLMAEARKIDPVLAEQHFKAIGMDTASQRADASRDAARIQAAPPEMRNQLITERAETLKAQGRDPSDTLQMLEMTPEQQNQSLTAIQLMDLSTKERFTARGRMADKAGLSAEVKSSKILDDGTNIQIMKDGSTRVVSPEGIELKGEARNKAIKDAQEFGVDIQQRRSKAREEGKLSIKAADKIFKAADGTRENIRNLQSVITELDRGAKSGVINKFLPTFTESTLRLKNLKNRLGLDVVGSTTFGALSESELNMAMDTALPEGLSPVELKKWAQDRIDAQRKAAQAMEEEAVFISKRGNTQAMWREKIMQEREEAANEEAPRETPPQQVTQPPAGQIKFLGFE